MSVMEAFGPDLSREQRAQVEALMRSLLPGQALWLGGYFTALGRDAWERPGEALDQPSVQRADLTGSREGGSLGAPPRSLTILFGSETGNSVSLARSAADSARNAGFRPTLVDMADYKPRALKDEGDLLLIASTHGEGDPPQSAKPFFEFLESRKAPKLAGKRFAVVALGDSTYEHYCEAGRRLDRRLEELGASRIAPRVECDVDYEEAAAQAVASALAAFGPARSQGAVSAAASSDVSSLFSASPAFDKHHPFPAAVIDNFALTAPGSTKETRHIELSLEGSGMAFEPGDALGVTPRNDPRLVEAILDSVALTAEASVKIKDRTMTLGEALASSLEIAKATPRLIDHWAQMSAARELAALCGESNAAKRAQFLRDNDVIDILRGFPVKGVDAQALIAGLRPLQPRLYSIASSQAAAPEEVHLTISTLRYELQGERRTGVTSGYFAKRAEPDASVPVYVQGNPHFHLPDDDVPILMIGAGTGVAPYRAFLQEREARGAVGKSWLVFGERNFFTDFLYQTEWQSFLKDGVLTRMTVAFSRDSVAKTYVQHRLRECAREVYAWLEEGAHLYVCGDANNLAPAVDAALQAVVQDEGRRGRSACEDYLASLQRNHRYHTDVY